MNPRSTDCEADALTTTPLRHKEPAHKMTERNESGRLVGEVEAPLRDGEGRREAAADGLQRRYMFRKGKTAVEGDRKESWSGIESEAGVE